MADSLILKGVKDVRKHAGTEMQLMRPKHGGDTWHLKEWWKNGVSKCYIDCTVFRVTTAIGSVRLALDTNMGTDIRIDHDGNFGFSFYGINEVRRAALFDDDFNLIEHYLFPAISRGKIVTATAPGAADRPTPPASPTIGNVTIAGNPTPPSGVTTGYLCEFDGTAADATFLWNVSGNLTVNNIIGKNIYVTFTPGDSQISCTVSSATASDSPQTGSLNITATATTTTTTETGPKAIDGYYPLYDLEASAVAAGDGTTHTHEFNGVTYYMPNGVTFYHGDYNAGGGY